MTRWVHAYADPSIRAPRAETPEHLEELVVDAAAGAGGAARITEVQGETTTWELRYPNDEEFTPMGRLG